MRVYQRSPYNTRSTELMPFVLVLVRVYKLYIFLKYGSPLTHRNLRLGCGGAAISRLPERLFGRQPRTLSPQDYRSSQKSGRCVDSGFQSFLHQCVGGVRAVCHPVLRIRQTPADEYRLMFQIYYNYETVQTSRSKTFIQVLLGKSPQVYSNTQVDEIGNATLG